MKYKKLEKMKDNKFKRAVKRAVGIPRILFEILVMTFGEYSTSRC